MEWKNTDPRIDIYKRANIVILRPGGFGASAASVETKNAYCIWTDYEDHKFINADEEWNEDWWWIFAPN